MCAEVAAEQAMVAQTDRIAETRVMPNDMRVVPLRSSLTRRGIMLDPMGTPGTGVPISTAPIALFTHSQAAGGDLDGGSVVKMSPEAYSACCWPTSQTSKTLWPWRPNEVPYSRKCSSRHRGLHDIGSRAVMSGRSFLPQQPEARRRRGRHEPRHDLVRWRPVGRFLA